MKIQDIGAHSIGAGSIGHLSSLNSTQSRRANIFSLVGHYIIYKSIMFMVEIGTIIVWLISIESEIIFDGYGSYRDNKQYLHVKILESPINARDINGMIKTHINMELGVLNKYYLIEFTKWVLWNVGMYTYSRDRTVIILYLYLHQIGAGISHLQF